MVTAHEVYELRKALYAFLTDDGNDVKWFSSKWIENLEQGGQYLLRGTVKSHDDGTDDCGEQKYAPSTVLTRCKILETL